jgi:tRNA A-37 threonylcarbamoyl transferase component Bud32
MNPEKIGRYEIRSELGRGGMATVYRAYDPRFEREVALKVLPREMLHDPQFRMRFEREAKTIAMLEHPVIVPVYDVGEEDGQPYFVMRYMTGGSLSERIKNGALSVAEAARIIDTIAPGLDDAHSKGIIHRDLKPGNILFYNHNKPYIADFGIAKFSQSQTNMTGSAIVGTPAYISPEQAQGEAIDGRSDIYALGIIVYEMLSGQAPYHATTPMAVVVKHITDPIPHILDVKPNLPPEIESVIEKAMAKDRNERFSTAVELAEALNEVAHGASPEFGSTMAGATRIQSPKVRVTAKPTIIGSKPATVPIPEQPKKSASPVPWVMIGVIVLCLVVVVGGGVGGYFFTKGAFSGATATATQPIVVVPSPNETATLPATSTADIQPTLAEPSATVDVIPTIEASPTPAAVVLPVIGGADKIAFLRNNDIWMMNIDGSDLTQITTDRAPKANLQWLPDGNTLLYTNGKLVKTVDINTRREEILVSYNTAKEFDAFQISPDGKQVAISLNRELFVVPFDPATLATAAKQSALINIVDNVGCLYYKDASVKSARWSNDGMRVALLILMPKDGFFTDIIRVLDISKCNTVPPDRLDDFPGQRFDFPREIASYSWDGDLLFLLNSNIRNGGFGKLFGYNMDTRKHEEYAPIDNVCCYRDAITTPDGSYVLFVFQDIRLGSVSPTQLYFAPYGALSDPGKLEPIKGDLPADFFNNLRDKPQPVLRPAKP